MIRKAILAFGGAVITAMVAAMVAAWIITVIFAGFVFPFWLISFML